MSAGPDDKFGRKIEITNVDANVRYVVSVTAGQILRIPGQTRVEQDPDTGALTYMIVREERTVTIAADTTCFTIVQPAWMTLDDVYNGPGGINQTIWEP